MRVIVNFLALAVLSSCEIEPGITTGFDQVPKDAMIVSQGSFNGANGVTGTAQVYSNHGLILLHIEGLTSPTGVLYYLFLENGSPTTPFFFAPLKASLGAQNYNTGRSNPGNLSRVAIRINGSTVSTEIAAAVLFPVVPVPVGAGLLLDF